jgi:transcription-repair coupling factor (superfamily II helicase)
MSSTARPSGNNTSLSSILEPAIPATRDRLTWTGLGGDSLPLAVAGLVDKHAGLVVVITPDMQSAELLQDQVEYFAAHSELKVTTLPDWETLPYDKFSPHPDIISERLATLYQLAEMQRGLLIVSVPTLLQRLPPSEYIYQNSLILKTGDTLKLDDMRTRLDNAGYRAVSQVMEHGEFAVRGSLLDIYPMGNDLPYRIDLFDEDIDSIRTFDCDSQRSLDTVESIRMLPAREFPMHEEAIRLFRRRFRAAFEGDSQNCSIYREVSQGNAPAGIEYYLPLFSENTCTLFDYLPDNAALLQLDATDIASENFIEQLEERYDARRHDIERPILPPDQLYINNEELQCRFGEHPCIQARLFKGTSSSDSLVDYHISVPGDVRIRPRSERPAIALQSFIDGFSGRILITAESTGRRETLLDQLLGFGLRPLPVENWHAFLESAATLCITVAPLEAGMMLNDSALAVITETALFGDHARQTRRRKPTRDPASVVRNLTDLEINAPVVHEENGVGRYLGLETIRVGDIETEYLALAYAGGDKLYVPVASLALVSRYTGASPENAPLHKLGSDQWERARKKATKRIHDVAVELLDIYARRAARKGYAYTAPQEEYQAFVSTFPFEETPDQEESIRVVLEDMQSDKPMDRLVCGDVGFGKTEVAMRAAFMAVQGGKQVALLVPTTLLAQQHYQNFCDRFADWPVRIELLSRFRSGKQTDAALAALQEGTVDIVVGTHKLLQPNVKYKRLGLLIIDEEHRFGVRQKESIKNLRSEVDILTLTATPIPRTLNMSLSGMRDLSIISTPPAHRLAVKTFVCEWDRETLREACLREIKRGGQIYFLHNDVATIDRMAVELAGIVPEAGIEIAHGQMRERDLEKVMLDFYHRRFNLLLCSTIIESGIDVPTANTIIMNRADKLGLAQLHQLRGRVGRSHHRAYAYLLVPPGRTMSADARKRLAAIESMEDIGAGFTLATHDLEIRGAGELLGEDQSGQIHEIGFTLYMDLLERAVKALKEGRSPNLDQPLHQGTEIDLLVPALLPDDFIRDVHTRLVLYKRVAGMETTADLRDLQVEMIDRFGILPDAAKNLFKIAELKLLAVPMRIRKIEVGMEQARVLFDSEPNINTDLLIELIQSKPQQYRFEAGNKLRIYGDFPTGEARYMAASELLGLLSPSAPVS